MVYYYLHALFTVPFLYIRRETVVCQRQCTLGWNCHGNRASSQRSDKIIKFCRKRRFHYISFESVLLFNRLNHLYFSYLTVHDLLLVSLTIKCFILPVSTLLVSSFLPSLYGTTCNFCFHLTFSNPRFGFYEFSQSVRFACYFACFVLFFIKILCL